MIQDSTNEMNSYYEAVRGYTHYTLGRVRVEMRLIRCLGQDRHTRCRS